MATLSLPLLFCLAGLGPNLPSVAALGVVLPRSVAELQCLVPGAGGCAKKTLIAVPRPRQCKDWPQRVAEHMGTEALPLDDKVWRGGYAEEYLPRQEDFARALQPAGYAGARLRLRKFMLKLVANEPVEVSVVGGSMTAGKYLVDWGMKSWPGMLEEHMRALGHRLTVHNLAVPQTGSEYAATHVVYDRPEVKSSDLVIIDTSINDWWDWNTPSVDRGSEDSFDLLAQELLELPHHPAVLALATLHMSDPKGHLNFRKPYCSTNLAHFPHARAEIFQLPIVSFPDAMCKCCGNYGLWIGNVHPNGVTQDAVARTLVGAFALEADAACKADGLEVADHRSHAQDLQAAPFSECLRLHKNTRADFMISGSAADGDPFVEGEHAGWHFAQDLPNKPFGWLLPSGSPAGKTINFKVNVSQGGWIRLDYLSTYEDIGSVTCWVDGAGPEHGCLIDPLLEGRFSVVRSAYIGLPSKWQAQLLHCRSHGGKFKVLGVASC